jgi:hypothetical protein
MCAQQSAPSASFIFTQSMAVTGLYFEKVIFINSESRSGGDSI